MSDNSPSRSCDRITPNVLKKYDYRSENQKYVLMCKTQSDEEHIYSKTNIEAALAAQRVFKSDDGAFRLYHRLSLHNPEYHFALSQKEIEDSIELSAKRYYKAVKKLIEAHYLEPIPGYPDMYIFYEYPQVDNPMYGLTSNPDGSTPPAELGVPSPHLEETPPAESGASLLPDQEYPSCQIGGTNIVYISQDTVSNTTEDITAGSACGSNSILSPERENEIASASGDINDTGINTLVESVFSIKPVHNGPWYIRTPWDILERERKVREHDLLLSGNWHDETAYREVVEMLVEYGYLSAKWEKQRTFGGINKYRKTKKHKIKHGIRVDGWNEETDEPMFTVGLFFAPPHLMRQRLSICEEVRDRLKNKHDMSVATTGGCTNGTNSCVSPKIALERDDGDLPF